MTLPRLIKRRRQDPWLEALLDHQAAVAETQRQVLAGEISEDLWWAKLMTARADLQEKR